MGGLLAGSRGVIARPRVDALTCGVEREKYTQEVSVRRVRYQVATSLDGYIAGPKGEADWIIMDPDIDFRALYAQFDTVLIGRRTFERMARGKKKPGAMPGMKTLVFSRTLRQRDYPKVTIIGENAEETVAALRAESGKDIWLFGGGSLFRSLLDAGQVDTVEVEIGRASWRERG